MNTNDQTLTAALALERQGNIAAARALLARQARNGDGDALYALGRNLLVCEPVMPGAGVNLLKSAAARGMAQASHLCAVIAAQDSQTPGNWDIAFEYLVQAAEQGSDQSRTELALLAEFE